MFVSKEYILTVIILLGDYTSPRDFHLLGAPQKNVGGHKFENNCEVGTVFTKWLITRTVISGVYKGCTNDKVDASVVEGTM
jgi:hypothetical protein